MFLGLQRQYSNVYLKVQNYYFIYIIINSKAIRNTHTTMLRQPQKQPSKPSKNNSIRKFMLLNILALILCAGKGLFVLPYKP